MMLSLCRGECLASGGAKTRRGETHKQSPRVGAPPPVVLWREGGGRKKDEFKSDRRHVFYERGVLVVCVCSRWDLWSWQDKQTSPRTPLLLLVVDSPSRFGEEWRTRPMAIISTCASVCKSIDSWRGKGSSVGYGVVVECEGRKPMSSCSKASSSSPLSFWGH